MADIINAIKVAMGMRNPEGVDTAKLAALRSLGDVNRRAYELKQQQEQQQVNRNDLSMVGNVASVLGQAEPTPSGFVGPTDSELGLPPVTSQEPTPPSIDLKALGVGSQFEPLIRNIGDSLRKSRHQKEAETELNNESIRNSRDLAASVVPHRIENLDANTQRALRPPPVHGMNSAVVPTGDDLDALGLIWRKTKTYPPRSTPEMTSAITHAGVSLTPARIADLEARGIDVATNAAYYGVDKSSLAQGVKSRDALATAEGTVDQNIQNLLNILDRGNITDTGTTFGNALTRGAAAAFGSEDQAQLNAAYAVVQPEIAKILTQFNPAVGQLSDNARKEVEAAINKNATIPQMRSVFTLLQLDRASRMRASNDVINQIKSRLSPGYLLPSTGGTSSREKYPEGTVIKNQAGVMLVRRGGQWVPK